ncbi:MAG: DEAD/DEAH box helicase family protein, partial [Oscillospiraceae bacterium]|nr:DEAD/DEAH box helicase family protein [Oscillospiraceae bacterium]
MFAKIAIDKAAFGFDKLFDYSVPTEFSEKIKPGCRVMVPFGAGGKKRQGMVFSLSEKPEGDPNKVKEIAFLLDEEPVVSEELTELAKYLAATTFCPLFEAVKAMLPPGLNFKPVYKYFANGESENEEEQRVINWLRKKKSGAEGENINKAFGFSDSSFIDSMAEKGLLKMEEATRRKIGDETEKMVRISEREAELNAEEKSLLKKPTPKQKEVLEFLSEVGCACVKEIGYFTSAGKAVLETLEKKGVLEFFEQETFRRPYKENFRRIDPESIVLSEEQQSAFDGIAKLCDDKTNSTALLFGVTGSGKTQVFLKLIQREIEKGKQVILMVPEISLTPQMMTKFFSYF